MITRINTYEGVPIGTENFENLLDYIRSFLGANFGFSTNLLSSNGGYFTDDQFAWHNRGNMALFSPSVKSVGNMFGKKLGEFYRFSVKNSVTGEPETFKWELLATEGEITGGSLTFSNPDIAGPRQLPYRPTTRVGQSVYDYGYYEVRFNGIPQDYNLSYPGKPAAAIRSQTLSFSHLNLGAEYPHPVKDGRYDGTFTNGGVTLSQFEALGSEVEFPYTNFNVDYGGHVMLQRETGSGRRFVYIPQDTAPTSEPSPGTYKVTNMSRGSIKLNITSSQMLGLLFPGEAASVVDSLTFTIISAEQLQETVSGGAVTYSSRYGSIYDGNTSTAVILAYAFDGQVHRLSEVTSGKLSSDVGSVLLSDSSGEYGDSVLLAISYTAKISKTEMLSVQRYRYIPDTFQLYYSPGILLSDLPGGATPSQDVRIIVEHNDSSWYNSESLDGAYLPVPRSVSTSYSYIRAQDTVDESFSPDYAFQIVDTVALQHLSDVPPSASLQDGDVYVYNTSTSSFNAVNLRLSNLRDVIMGTPLQGQVLGYHLGAWRPINAVQSLGFTPVNKAGDSGISGILTYSPSASGTFSSYSLVTKQYVDSAVSGASGGSNSNITAHANLTGENAHGGSKAANPNTITVRDSAGMVHSTRSGWTGHGGPISPSIPLYTNTLTAGWLSENMSLSATPNTIPFRSGQGRLYSTASQWSALSSSSPPAGGQDTEVVTTSWIVDNARSSPDPRSLMRRDISGRAQVASPFGPSDIVNLGFLQTLLSGQTPSYSSSGLSRKILPGATYAHVRIGPLLLVTASQTIPTPLQNPATLGHPDIQIPAGFSDATLFGMYTSGIGGGSSPMVPAFSEGQSFNGISVTGGGWITFFSRVSRLTPGSNVVPMTYSVLWIVILT